MATFLLVTEVSMENTLHLLKKILYIHYLFCFQKDLYKTKALFNLDSEINAVTSTYIAKLGLKI